MPLSKGLQVSPHSDLSINSGMRGVYGALTAFPLLQHSRCWEAVLEVLHSNLLRGGAELSLERMMFRIYCLPWSLSPAIEGGGGVGSGEGGPPKARARLGWGESLSAKGSPAAWPSAGWGAFPRPAKLSAPLSVLPCSKR